MGGVDQNHSNQDIGEKKYKTYFGNGTLVICETLQWVGVGGSSFLCLLSRNTSTHLIGKQSGGVGGIEHLWSYCRKSRTNVRQCMNTI